ncbi:DUF4935 domain-containing protein [Paenibacillus thiaminolyticus]|uniref:PIN-like domain-containing protein n=1 Tax=Paenibacillus thiaminolyticus TaxID=49283 RepID=UPI001163E0D6|nr:PIN-like domain-containing protein [Paenibacillus thiaminolyticus]NGP59057.1 DUF4935 domain-containing protein [Paenibacillus thiaminolyticus]
MMKFEEFKTFWDEQGLIVLDTNVLLNLYNYPIESTRDIVSSITAIKDRIWLPHQVLLEFENNKKQVSQKAFSKYEKIKKDVEKLLDNTVSELYDTLGKCNKFKYPTFNEIISLCIHSINESRKELENVNSEIELEKKLNRELVDNDIVQNLMELLKNKNQIGTGFNHIELINIYVEGDTRFKLGIPPGYKDKKKLNGPAETAEDYQSKRKAYGDLIIWKEILNKAININKDILFITDDEKVDWWSFEITDNKITNRQTKLLNGPHPELILEFRGYSNRKFHMLTFSTFIDFITDLNISTSMMLHFQLNKSNILMHYVSMQINYDEININYIINDLDSYFDYEATKYEVSVDSINFDDEDDIFFEINGLEVNISGRFKISLTVDGEISKDNQTIIKSMRFGLECESNITLELNERDFRKYTINGGDIRVLKTINNDIIAIVSDDIDIYDIYDMKIRIERAFDTNNKEEISEYEYKLYETFGHIDFFSIEDEIDEDYL